jgi:hypothetical protein
MSDIEERLRTGLAVLADEVAPTDEPRAELDRRLGARRRAARRAPVIVATAAAAAVVAVFTPIVASQDPPSAGAPAGSKPTTSAVAELPLLGTLVRGGETVRAVGYLDADQYCTALAQPGDKNVTLSCEPVPTWPEGPNKSFVQSREVLNSNAADDTGMLAHRLVFLTDPQVATLAVRRGDGTAVRVTELDRNEYAALYLGDFAGPPDGFGYTARAADGRVVEEAIS